MFTGTGLSSSKRYLKIVIEVLKRVFVGILRILTCTTEHIHTTQATFMRTCYN